MINCEIYLVILELLFFPRLQFGHFPPLHLSISSPFLASLRKHITSTLIAWVARTRRISSRAVLISQDTLVHFVMQGTFLILCSLNDKGVPYNGMKLVGKRIFQVF